MQKDKEKFKLAMYHITKQLRFISFRLGDPIGPPPPANIKKPDAGLKYCITCVDQFVTFLEKSRANVAIPYRFGAYPLQG